MDTPECNLAKRVYFSTKVTNNKDIHGENQNKRKYTKTNAPTITKISHHMRGQDIMEEDMQSIISTPSGKTREKKNLTSCGSRDGHKV